MSRSDRLARVRTLLVKDLKLGPRSPLVLWALIIPVAVTLLVRGVFGGLFDAPPRLGIVDLGASEVVAAAGQLDGIDLTVLDDTEELRRLVEADDLDAGLILQEGFDEAVRSGSQPELHLFVGGSSLASTRIVVAVTALDLVRGLEDRPAPFDVELVIVGDEPIPLGLRMLPLVVIMAVALAGVMIPAASLIEEKQARTLDALLVTPSTMSDVLATKGTLGALLAVAAGTITLTINGVLGHAPGVTIPAIVLGAVMMAQLGLILGCWAKDTSTLFAAWKSGGLILFYPVVFFMWPDLPTWPAMFGPTYYFLAPVHEASVGTPGDAWWQLTVAAALCLALAPATVAMGRRLEGRIGAPAARKHVGANVD